MKLPKFKIGYHLALCLGDTPKGEMTAYLVWIGWVFDSPSVLVEKACGKIPFHIQRLDSTTGDSMAESGVTVIGPGPSPDWGG